MNFFGLYYKLIVCFATYRLGLCDESQYPLHTESIRVFGVNGDYGPTLISKYQDRFIFQSDELNTLVDGPFTYFQVEILALFDRTMRISITRKKQYLQYYLDIVFLTKEEVQQFFEDLRSPPSQISDAVLIKKMYQYTDNDQPSSVEKLALVSRHDYLYERDLDSRWFEDPKIFNFVHVRHVRAHVADLIVQSKTFNISPRLDDDKYVLCSLNADRVHIFVLLFPDEKNAKDFNDTVKDYVDGAMDCPHDWLTPELLEEINSPMNPE